MQSVWQSKNKAQRLRQVLEIIHYNTSLNNDGHRHCVKVELIQKESHLHVGQSAPRQILVPRSHQRHNPVMKPNKNITLQHGNVVGNCCVLPDTAFQPYALKKYSNDLGVNLFIFIMRHQDQYLFLSVSPVAGFQLLTSRLGLAQLSANNGSGQK